MYEQAADASALADASAWLGHEPPLREEEEEEEDEGREDETSRDSLSESEGDAAAAVVAAAAAETDQRKPARIATRPPPTYNRSFSEPELSPVAETDLTGRGESDRTSSGFSGGGGADGGEWLGGGGVVGTVWWVVVVVVGGVLSLVTLFAAFLPIRSFWLLPSPSPCEIARAPHCCLVFFPHTPEQHAAVLDRFAFAVFKSPRRPDAFKVSFSPHAAPLTRPFLGVRRRDKPTTY